MNWLIPDARLAILDCGHLFLVTRPAESARIVEAFLTAPDARDRTAATTNASSSTRSE